MTAAVAVTILFYSLIGGLFLWERAALREGCLCVGKRKRHGHARLGAIVPYMFQFGPRSWSAAAINRQKRSG